MEGMTRDEACAQSAIRIWAYWCFNWDDPNVWIREIWGHGVDGNHFMNKFVNECNSDMSRFYVELSRNNQELLTSWVLRNYHP